MREVLVLSALICAAPALSRAAGAGASGDAPLQQGGPRQAAGAADPAVSSSDAGKREETGRDLRDYAGRRDPSSLNKAMPDLVRYAQSADGRRFLAELFRGMRETWARGGGKDSPEDAVLSEMARYAPEDGAVWRMLVERRAKGSDPSATIEAADNALRFGGPDPKVFEARAQAGYKLGDYAAAWRDARAALELDPRDRSAFAVMKLSEGRLQLAPAPAPGAASGAETPGAAPSGAGAGPTPAPGAAGRDASAQSAVLTREAISALALGDASAALRKADAALALDSGNAQALNLRATAEVRLARYREAVADATRALDLAPGSAAALTTRAWARGRLGDFTRALADASAAVDAAPSDPAARFAKAFGLAGFGRSAEMLDELRTAAALHPTFLPVYERAVRAPAGSDAMLLFTALEPGRSAPEPRRGRRPLLVVVLAVLVGGFLVALGLLQNLAGLRERFTRRLGARVSAVPEGGGFWKRFTKVREAGAGGMGVVYEAVDLGLRRKVAVKRMREELRADPRERRRFLEEARAAAALRHPHVVAVHGVEEEGEDLYMVCEFIEGPSLEKRLKARGPLPEAEALLLALQVCSALEAAHALRVVHGDIKPSNILLEPDGTAKVADFGLARRLDAVRRTVPGASWGSPAYMAPEQEEGRMSPQSDLYALGALLYEALVGAPPFMGTPSAVLLRKREGRYEPAGRKAPLSAATEALIARALEPDPERRWRTARELSAAIEAAYKASKGS